MGSKRCKKQAPRAGARRCGMNGPKKPRRSRPTVKPADALARGGRQGPLLNYYRDVRSPCTRYSVACSKYAMRSRRSSAERYPVNAIVVPATNPWGSASQAASERGVQ